MTISCLRIHRRSSYSPEVGNDVFHFHKRSHNGHCSFRGFLHQHVYGMCRVRHMPIAHYTQGRLDVRSVVSYEANDLMLHIVRHEDLLDDIGDALGCMLLRQRLGVQNSSPHLDAHHEMRCHGQVQCLGPRWSPQVCGAGYGVNIAKYPSELSLHLLTCLGHKSESKPERLINKSFKSFGDAIFNCLLTVDTNWWLGSWMFGSALWPSSGNLRLPHMKTVACLWTFNPAPTNGLVVYLAARGHLYRLDHCDCLVDLDQQELDSPLPPPCCNLPDGSSRDGFSCLKDHFQSMKSVLVEEWMGTIGKQLWWRIVHLPSKISTPITCTSLASVNTIRITLVKVTWLQTLEHTFLNI